MLSKIINKHIDTQEVIESRVVSDLDAVMAKLDIDAILQDPLEAMLQVAEVMEAKMIDDYAKDAIKNGQEFSKIVDGLKKSGKDIVIEQTNNPKENEDAR